MSDSSDQPYVFPSWANYLLPVVLLMIVGAGMYVPATTYLTLSAGTLNPGYRPEQPVPYSHELHAGELGMDCTYCHTTVEDAAFAAIPPTQTCINCHNPETDAAGLRKNSDKLQPVYESYRTGKPVKWVKVHDLADYSYFNHSAHVNKGVGCYSCHGRVDKMGEEGVYQVENLSMGWCIECHREPEKHLRPLDQVTSMTYHLELPKVGDETDEEAQLRIGLELKEKYNIHSIAYMTSCSTCHR
ncbi:cytochrome c3 family protein [Mucisphaera calidilacus]|uniref:Class III cytochrome C family protein n=1 Tax=Mucisphaera calidilacus TaxID=2527982 RepID=A0A518C0E8_9BACT|nr:cytochrome c3 family protein [Mucisphaera calidilacus]QDU72692.1 Class III cytochrome C family protein [Mucisphaera calidilacus]